MNEILITVAGVVGCVLGLVLVYIKNFKYENMGLLLSIASFITLICGLTMLLGAWVIMLTFIVIIIIAVSTVAEGLGS